MRPVMLHADGTECGHEGPAARTLHDEGGPACPAGIEVTHVRSGEKDIPVDEAVRAMMQVGDAIAKVLTPMISQAAVLIRGPADLPAIRVAHGAAAAIEAEREREEASRT